MAKKKILIVDDSKYYLKLLCSNFEDRSFSMKSERRADVALLDIIKWNPDLLITGVEVGDINGYDLCLILRMIPDFAGMPIVLMSSHETDVASRKAAAAGADYYVQKDNELVVNIERGIERLLFKTDDDPGQEIEKRPIRSVLVVDDSSTMRRIIRNILTSIGIGRIIEADNGATGLKELSENTVDMVISDWNMPKMNGFQFIKSVRANPVFKDLYFVLVTAEGAREIEEAKKAGANDHLCKPFTVESMKTLIDKFRSGSRDVQSKSLH
jgi:two-component system chemotaxis response regulator CheY